MALYHPRCTVINSGGALVNEVIHPHPCIIHQIHVYHGGGAAAIIQVHDVSSAPANGAVPTMVHSVAANSDATIEGDGWPLYFQNGVYVCESSTIATKTLSVSSDLFIHLIIEDITH